MLKQISSNVFREKTIKFHEGLNAILGDDKGSNSIGKSSLLMIIDFIYGGNSYIKENIDTVKHLGHHYFEFVLEINGKNHFYRRGTESSKIVEVCDIYFRSIRNLELKEYTNILKESYFSEIANLSFRSAVGTFSRVAQKKNKFDTKPLKVVVNSKEKDCVNNLIKLFDLYSELEEIEKDIKLINKELNAIANANEFNYINKITKRTYNKNLRDIEKENEIVKKMSIEMSLKLKEYELENRNNLNYELYELKRSKELEKSKIRRIIYNLSKTKALNKTTFKSLSDYFSNVNVEKLNQVGEFYESITDILSEELQRELEKSEESLLRIEKDIEVVEKEILENSIDGTIPEDILAPLSELIISINNKKEENKIYLKHESKNEDKKSKKKKLADDKIKIITNIMNFINEKMKELNFKIYHDYERTPKFDITANNHYLSLEDNTGTGRGDSNLVIFDLSILALTELPFIIHDSIMFKNIGNIPMVEIIKLYETQNKQCFIAVDEINTYGEIASSILKKKKVIELSSKKVLFIEDWTGYER